MARANEQFQPPSSETLAAGYETSTVSVKGLAWFVVGLIVVGAAVHIAVWYLLRSYHRADARQDQPYSAVADATFMAHYNKTSGARLNVVAMPPPPAPRIQISEPDNRRPEEDLQKMYNDENDIFGRMGWKTDARTPARLAIPSQDSDAVINQENSPGSQP